MAAASSIRVEPDDVEPHLEQRHREVMLDLVLAWGALDGALGIVLSRAKGLPLDEGAEFVGKRSNAVKFAKVCEALEGLPGADEAVAVMGRHRDRYEELAVPRNRIAHSRCIGVWRRDRDYVLFAAFEKVREGELAIYLVSIQAMQDSIRWGEDMTEVLLRFADAFAEHSEVPSEGN